MLANHILNMNFYILGILVLFVCRLNYDAVGMTWFHLKTKKRPALQWQTQEDMGAPRSLQNRALA